MYFFEKNSIKTFLSLKLNCRFSISSIKMDDNAFALVDTGGAGESFQFILFCPVLLGKRNAFQ